MLGSEESRRSNASATREPSPQWIGVEWGWRSFTDNPLERLVQLPIDRLRLHCYIAGATGSGKTVSIQSLFAQDILAGHSFVVLDLRGDLVACALEILAGRVDHRKVRIIDLREKFRPTGFNPLKGSGEPYYQALGVLDAISDESESFGVQLAETLRWALILLAELGEPLTRLEDLLYDLTYLQECLARCQSERTATFWERFAAYSDDKRAALAMPVLNKVSALFATETLRHILGHQNPIDLATHLNTPGSVLLVSLAVDELHSAGRMMGRMILSSISREIFARVDVPESKRNPVRLYVDEFENFGSEAFEPILAEGRRFKFSLLLAHQTLAQLNPKFRSIVLGNVGTKLIFRTGREDAATFSRDLTGDPKAINFADFPVGHAVLWFRGAGWKPIELNAPIVKDVGRRSPAASRMLEQIKSANPLVSPEAVRNGKSPPTPKEPPANEPPRRLKSDLGDWLCD